VTRRSSNTACKTNGLQSDPLNGRISRIAITPGEPSGIGPDVVLGLAAKAWPVEIVAIADPGLLQGRAVALGAEVDITSYDAESPPVPSEAGRLLVCERPLAAKVTPGQPDVANASYVLDTLERACAGCLAGEFSALVTGPVSKGLIVDSGTPFSGHTEFLAERTKAPQPVMLLVADELRVALVTTHLALRDVPRNIDRARITHVLQVLNTGLKEFFGIEAPRIIVLGLNPHAGESGHLGTEELEIIGPSLDALRADGMDLVGPLPADTAFTPAPLENADAVLAMYHDQGLPALKAAGFGRSVNVTLGLPIIRTSVDHGTAFELAGSGRANPDSMKAALNMAIEIQARQT
jgi:4-hydroxythreonine-4-phosphate dehydrogenase